MFIDETVIKVKAGDGGNGCYAHDRQKYKPRGRPSGGSGGRGGHVVLEASSQLHTLQDVAYRKSYKAERGTHGKGSTKDGAKGTDVVVQVPVGTIVYDIENGSILQDFSENGSRFIVARGGHGGRGNAALTTVRNPNPERAQEGKPGEERKLRLELKVLADIGLVGRPNAGKSTFLSRVSKARPKIADYPFTTTEPNLGIVKFTSGYESYVVADIPGLIEGAHTGKGLGIRFLRHIERTRILAVLVEADSDDPERDADTLLEELAHYSPALAGKPKCFILSKSDLLGRDHSEVPSGWTSMSAVTGEGLKTVLHTFEELLSNEPG